MNFFLKIVFLFVFTAVFIVGAYTQNSVKKNADLTATPSVQKVVFEENKTVEPTKIYLSRKTIPSKVIPTVSKVAEPSSEIMKSQSIVPENNLKLTGTKLTVKNKASIVKPTVTKIE